MRFCSLPLFHLSTCEVTYSGTSPYGHPTSKKTSQLQPPWLSPKLYSTVQMIPCNKVTSPLRSLLPSPVGDLNSEVPLYIYIQCDFSILAGVYYCCKVVLEFIEGPMISQCMAPLSEICATIFRRCSYVLCDIIEI